MKKRKPPIFLAALLAVTLGAVVVINAGATSKDDDHGHQEEPVTEKPRKTDPKRSIIQEMQMKNQGEQPFLGKRTIPNGHPMVLKVKPPKAAKKAETIVIREPGSLWYAPDSLGQ